MTYHLKKTAENFGAHFSKWRLLSPKLMTTRAGLVR